MFNAAIHAGAAVLNLPADEDHVIVDYAALTADSLFDDLDEAEVLLTRINGTYAAGLIVAGRVVMQDGLLTNVDFEAARRALLDEARADLPRLQGRMRGEGIASSPISPSAPRRPAAPCLPSIPGTRRPRSRHR